MFENTRFEDLDGKKKNLKMILNLGKYWALGDLFVNDALELLTELML